MLFFASVFIYICRLCVANTLCIACRYHMHLQSFEEKFAKEVCVSKVNYFSLAVIMLLLQTEERRLHDDTRKIRFISPVCVSLQINDIM